MYRSADRESKRKKERLQNNNKNGCTKAQDSQAVRRAYECEWVSEWDLLFVLFMLNRTNVQLFTGRCDLSLSPSLSQPLLLCHVIFSSFAHIHKTALKSERETWIKLKMKLTNDEPWRWNPDSIEIISECAIYTYKRNVLCSTHTHNKRNAMHEMRSFNIGFVHVVFQTFVPIWISVSTTWALWTTYIQSIRRRHTFAHRPRNITEAVLWLLHASHNLCYFFSFLILYDFIVWDFQFFFVLVLVLGSILIKNCEQSKYFIGSFISLSR